MKIFVNDEQQYEVDEWIYLSQNAVTIGVKDDFLIKIEDNLSLEQ